MSARKLPLRLSVTLTSSGETATARVACPRLDAMIDAADCLCCPQLRSISGPIADATDADRSVDVTCEAEPIGIDRRADFGEVAARLAVREVLAPLTVSVTPDMQLGRLRRLVVERALRAVVVVDPEGKLQGILSRSDLTNARGKRRVGDLMPARVHALPEDAPISYAVGLMASADISEIPVVRADGTVLGLCHSLDVLRWVATGMGYVVAGRPADQPI